MATKRGPNDSPPAYSQQVVPRTPLHMTVHREKAILQKERADVKEAKEQLQEVKAEEEAKEAEEEASSPE